MYSPFLQKSNVKIENTYLAKSTNQFSNIRIIIPNVRHFTTLFVLILFGHSFVEYRYFFFSNYSTVSSKNINDCTHDLRSL